MNNLKRILAAAVFLLLCSVASAQRSTVTANLTASSTACATAGSCVTVTIDQNEGGAGFTLAGTWSGTVQFEGSADGGTTYQSINATPSNSTTAVTSATGNGVWQANVAGFTHVRIRCSTFSSGTIVATINGSSASARTSGSGGAGAVSSVFTRTGAVVAASGDYTLDQIGNPAAVKTFSLGTNNPLGFSSAGVFTTGAQHEYLQSIAGASCPQSLILNTASTTFVTDGMSGCVNIPAGAGVTNGFSSGVAGYVQNNNSSSLGQFGKAIGVGVFGAAMANANNTKVEGISAQVYSASSLTGVFLEASEVGVSPANTTDTGYGVLASFEGGTVQPTGDNMPAFAVQTPTSTGTFTTGFECQAGSTSQNQCALVGPTATGNGHNSQAINFGATNSVGGSVTAGFSLNQDGELATGNHTFSVLLPSADESFSVALTATASIAQNTVVKIDTANADSVVVCTTADTFCNGFVAGTNGTNGLCAAGGTFCPISTAGSKVQPVLGTGTCAIGNWVIPDTTTNGRVKCATVQPVAWQGFALSTNSTVGTTLDVLVSPGGASNVNAKTYSTATNCAGVGTAASPSVASCGSAAAGHFSCATNATGATCQVNTTAVTANSEIFVFESDTAVTGTALGVTCNTGTNVLPASRLLASSVAATSFTINLGTVTTNPACFSYNIVN